MVDERPLGPLCETGIRREAMAPERGYAWRMLRKSTLAFAILSCAPDSVTTDVRTEVTLAAIARVPGLASPTGQWAPAGRGSLDVRLPRSARDSLRIALRGHEGFWLEVRATDAEQDVPARTVRGVQAMIGVGTALDVVHVRAPTEVEELRVLHGPGAATTARYLLSVGPAVQNLSLNDGRVELRDAQGYVRLASAPMFAVDAAGSRRDLTVSLVGSTLTTTLDGRGLAYPIVVDPVWAAAGSMKTGRMKHAATALADGRVLLSGGQLLGNEPIDSAELFDPAKDTWTATPPMGTKRTRHAAVTLPTGKVLVVGGLSTTSTFSKMSSAELFDPATGNWSPAPSAKEARENPYAALLPTGKVLVVGGGPSAELFDPVANSWSNAASLPAVLHGGGHGALLVLDDGRAAFLEYKRVHIYDPAANKWTDGPDFPTERANCVLAPLPGARVLALAGFGALSGGGFGPLASGDIYAATTATWVAAPALKQARIWGTLTARTSTSLVMVGGLEATPGTATPESEVFDAPAATWSSSGALARGRVYHTTTVLAGGQLLVAGGAGDSTASPTSTAERFFPTGSAVASCKDAVTSVGKDGVEQPCGAFRCGDDGKCKTDCKSSTDCAPGNACDTATSRCGPGAAPATSSEGGCATGHAPPSGLAWWGLALLGVVTRARRRASAVGIVTALAGCSSEARVDATPAILDVDPRGTVLTRADDGFRVLARKDPRPGFVPTGAANLEVTLPLHANAPLRMAVRGRPGFWLEVRGVSLAAARGVATAGSVVYRDAAPALDLVHVTDGTRVEELRVLRDPRAPASARYALTTGPEVAAVTLREGRIELRDAAGYVRLASAPMFAVDARGVRRDLAVTLEGSAVLAALDTSGLTHPITVDPTWAAAATMKEARSVHAAVRLGDGRVLVVGGTKMGDVPIASAELYDPKADAWSSAGAMATARANFAVALLANGKVLVAGGNDNALPTSSTPKAELYDPLANAWSAAPSMAATRANAYAAPLEGGKVLVAGGSSTAEIYDATSNTWSTGGTLSGVEKNTGGLLVAEGGKVVLLSGDHVRVYDPKTGKWTDGPNAPNSRNSYTPIALPDGRLVAMAGGITLAGGFRLPMGGDIYSAASNSWVAKTSEGVKGRWWPSVTLRDGKQLVVIGGALDVGDALNSAEIYEIATDVWGPGGNMTEKRTQHSATMLENGRVLIAGGAATNRDIAARHSTAELFIPDGSAVNACKDPTTSVGKDGIPKPCAPYRCGTDGNCETQCNTSADCAPGAVCDPATRTCSAPAAATADSGGCALGVGASHLVPGALAMLTMLGALRTRKRRASKPS